MAPPDVHVRFGHVPAHLDDARLVRGRFEIGRDDAIVRTRRIADYWIRGADRVLVSPKNESSDAEISLMLFGGVLGVLLQRRGALALHAGAVNVGGQAVLFLGRSGSGKSTAVTALLRRGHRFLDDNLAVLTDRDGAFSVEPGVAELRLCDDGRFPPGCGSPSSYYQNIGKSRAPATDFFSTAPAPVGAIYVLRPCDVSRPCVAPISGAARFAVLHAHVFCAFLATVGDEQRRFPALVRLADTVRIGELRRPLSGSPIDLLAETVEHDLQNAVALTGR